VNCLFLDPYKKSCSRISKDTAGGYGTENSIGDDIISILLSLTIKSSVHWPNLSFMQLIQEFEVHDFHCTYSQKIKSYENNKKNWDAIFICSSIVCFETEINALKSILKTFKNPVFLCGTISEHLSSHIPSNVCVLSGNYEFFPQYLKKNSLSFSEVFQDKLLRVPNGNSDSLQIIDYRRKNFPKMKNHFVNVNKFFIPFIATRGCPYSCFEYCTYPLSQGRKTHHDDIDSVVKKLSLLAKNYPNSHVVFRDPVFSINLTRAKELLRKIHLSNLDLDFSAELHLHNIDDEFILLCKKARFTMIKFGIESAFQEIRSDVKRFSVKNDRQKEVIKKLKEFNIKTVGMFILAQPSDTEESCLSTIKYACSLGLDIAQFSIFTPYPGTPYHTKNSTNMNFNKFEDINQYNLVYKHKSLSKKKAKSLLAKAYKTFIMHKILNLLK
tara:strand:- start:2868 stop:4187 length:1320 start_codon:yes stop_codon:yes gene_type:complete